MGDFTKGHTRLSLQTDQKTDSLIHTGKVDGGILSTAPLDYDSRIPQLSQFSDPWLQLLIDKSLPVL